MRVTPLGDSALLINLDSGDPEEGAALAQRLTQSLVADPLPGVHDIVPAFTSVCVYFAPSVVPSHEPSVAVEAWARARFEALDMRPVTPRRKLVIPVSYGGEAGPDLADVAARAGLSVAEAITLHSTAAYTVQAVGFTPGFPYLSGLPERLRMPRLATPRTRVPAGSVGIGGDQTGIYPLETPGGWNLIGRTPLPLFDAGATPPARLQVGDAVRFEPLRPEEFARLKTQAGRLPAPAAASFDVPADAPALEIVKPGVWTTVQDTGRRGWQAQGVPVGGAMDAWALRVANLLVGNAPDAAALECTLRGPLLRFACDTVVAITGAAVGGLPAWLPFVARAGEALSIEAITGGCRAYVAIAGGIEVTPVLGSRSTYSPAGFGGWDGRALRAGDRLPLGMARVTEVSGRWRLSPAIVPVWSAESVLRVLPGAQAAWFAEDARAILLNKAYRVDSKSDRMGLRLNGAKLPLREPRDMRSEGVGAGTVQVPPDGQPIVLAADSQTIGGYPKIAHVISVDLPKLAQLRPGDSVRFVETTLEEAQQQFRERERDLGILRAGLYQRYGLS